MQFSTLFTVLATLAATYAAPSYTTVSCPESTGKIGGNLQNFNGALGGIHPPGVYGTSVGFETCRKEYTSGGTYDALVASCKVQEDNCLNADAAKVSGVTKAGCESQYTNCENNAEDQSG